MIQATCKAYAKLNISLKITGVNGGYHMLDSVVASVDKHDVITVKKRRDDKILVTFTGKYAKTPKKQADTNAYKAAAAFIEKYGVSGVNITVVRNIPTGSGMGGSAADIAGVLGAMKKLFNVKESVKPLADALGSDSGYLLKCGYARLTGRGIEIKEISSDKRYYFVVIYASKGVDTKKCFDLYDEMGGNLNIDNDSVERALISGDVKAIAANSGNDLYLAAKTINPEIEENLNALKSLSPDFCQMTGSGSTCFAMYSEYEMATWAYSKLKRKYSGRVEVLDTYNPKALSFFDKLFNLYPPEQD